MWWQMFRVFRLHFFVQFKTILIFYLKFLYFSSSIFFGHLFYLLSTTPIPYPFLKSIIIDYIINLCLALNPYTYLLFTITQSFKNHSPHLRCNPANAHPIHPWSTSFSSPLQPHCSPIAAPLQPLVYPSITPAHPTLPHIPSVAD